MPETIRLVLAAVCFAGAIITLALSVLGVYKFTYVMNRMHCAAIIDTMVLFLILVGLIILSGNMAYIPKLVLVICFQWVSSPIASHMVSRLEVQTDDHIADYMKFDNEVEGEGK